MRFRVIASYFVITSEFHIYISKNGFSLSTKHSENH
jgi:hypothetical protein